MRAQHALRKGREHLVLAKVFEHVVRPQIFVDGSARLPEHRRIGFVVPDRGGHLVPSLLQVLGRIGIAFGDEFREGVVSAPDAAERLFRIASPLKLLAHPAEAVANGLGNAARRGGVHVLAVLAFYRVHDSLRMRRASRRVDLAQHFDRRGSIAFPVSRTAAT